MSFGCCLCWPRSNRCHEVCTPTTTFSNYECAVVAPFALTLAVSIERKKKKTAQPSAILLLDLGQKHVTAGARVVTSWSAFGSHWAMKHVRMKNYKETGRGEDHRTCPRLGVVQIRYRLFRDRTRRTLRRFGIDFVGISTPVSERFMALLMRVG